MKYSDGWTRQCSSVLTLATMAASLYCLALAVRVISVGTAYAIWTGIGAAGTAILGMVLFAESAAPSRRASG